MSIIKGYVSTGDGQLHFRRCDDGAGPPVVLLHMTASTSESFVPLMEALSGQKPSLAFDTPNYGQSFKTSREPTMAYIAANLLEGLQNLGIDEFHLLGHHTGASIAVEMALQAPDAVKSISLGGLVYISPGENAEVMKALVIDNPITPHGTQIMWAWTRAMKMDPMFWGSTPPDILHREVIDTLTAGEQWHWAYRAVFSYDVQRTVHSVTCPIFLLCAERDPAMAYHVRAVEALPEAKVLTAQGHGVYYLETGATEVASHVLEFTRAAEQVPAGG